VKGEEAVVAVGEGNLIGREDIPCASDKTVVEVHGGQVPSEAFPEEGGCEKSDCMKVGRGERVEMEEGAGRMDVRFGRHSRSGHEGSEAKKEYHGVADMRIYVGKSHQGKTYVWGMCGRCAYRRRARTGAFVGLMSLVTRTRSSAWVL